MDYTEIFEVEDQTGLNEKLDGVKNDSTVDSYFIQAKVNTAGTVTGYVLIIVRFGV